MADITSGEANFASRSSRLDCVMVVGCSASARWQIARLEESGGGKRASLRNWVVL